mmetsp:Transcript_25439/g.59222  ORF Transcript_25439/g.59222 Transcript_25439/m.59222 type:complete len:272 (+) Transcript_25439:231-1046(+)
MLTPTMSIATCMVGVACAGSTLSHANIFGNAAPKEVAKTTRMAVAAAIVRDSNTDACWIKLLANASGAKIAAKQTPTRACCAMMKSTSSPIASFLTARTTLWPPQLPPVPTSIVKKCKIAGCVAKVDWNPARITEDVLWIKSSTIKTESRGQNKCMDSIDSVSLWWCSSSCAAWIGSVASSGAFEALAAPDAPLTSSVALDEPPTASAALYELLFLSFTCPSASPKTMMTKAVITTPRQSPPAKHAAQEPPEHSRVDAFSSGCSERLILGG